MGADTKEIKKSELVDFGEYENVSIYPVFKAATGYTVTIRSINNLTNSSGFNGWLPTLGPYGELVETTPNSDLLSHEDIVRFVEKSQKFEWSTELCKHMLMELFTYRYDLPITCYNPDNYEEKTFGFNGFSIYDKNMTLLGNALYINDDESNYEYQTLTFKNSSGIYYTEFNRYSCGVTQSDTYDLVFTPLKDLILVPQHFSAPTVEVEYICDGLSSDWTLKVSSISGWYAGRTETKIVKYYEKDSAGPTLDSKDSPYFTYYQVSSNADDISQTTYTTHFVWKHTEHDMGTLYEGCKYCSFTYNTSGGSDGTGGSTHTCSESDWEYDESEHFKRKCANVNCSNYKIKIEKGSHSMKCSPFKSPTTDLCCEEQCEVCGYTRDCTCEKPCTCGTHKHIMSDWIGDPQAYRMHYRECTVKDCSYYEREEHTARGCKKWYENVFGQCEFKCAICKQLFAQNHVIDSLGYDKEYSKACTESVVLRTGCLNCGKTTDPEIIGPLGHKWTNYKISKELCTRTCSRCNIIEKHKPGQDCTMKVLQEYGEYEGWYLDGDKCHGHREYVCMWGLDDPNGGCLYRYKETVEYHRYDALKVRRSAQYKPIGVVCGVCGDFVEFSDDGYTNIYYVKNGTDTLPPAYKREKITVKYWKSEVIDTTTIQLDVAPWGYSVGDTDNYS